MKKNFSEIKNDILIKQRNVMILFSCIFILIIFFQSICLVKKDSKTILVPFINHQVSLNNSKPSNEYIVAITRDIFSLLLNLTPDNIDYSQKTILGLVDSAHYGEIKNQFLFIKEKILSKKFNTVFYITEIIPNNNNLTAIVSGNLYSYLGTKQTNTEEKKFEIKFKYKNSQLLLVGFNEVIEDKGVSNE